MKKMLKLSVALTLITFGQATAQEHLEQPQPDKFQTEVDQANYGFDHTTGDYKFLTEDAKHELNPMYVVAGRDVLDNKQLGILFKDEMEQLKGTNTMHRSARFTYDEVVFNKETDYTWEKKQYDRVVIDGQEFKNVLLLRVHEVTTIRKDGLDLPWQKDVHYYSVLGPGRTIKSTVVYWQDKIGVLMNRAKYVLGIAPGTTRKAAADPSLTEMMLSPVPAKNEVNVSITSAQDLDDATINILDMSGKLLLSVPSGKIERNRPLNVTLDIRAIPSGIYIVHFNSVNVRLSRKLIITQ